MWLSTKIFQLVGATKKDIISSTLEDLMFSYVQFHTVFIKETLIGLPNH